LRHVITGCCAQGTPYQCTTGSVVAVQFTPELRWPQHTWCVGLHRLLRPSPAVQAADMLLHGGLPATATRQQLRSAERSCSRWVTRSEVPNVESTWGTAKDTVYDRGTQLRLLVQCSRPQKRGNQRHPRCTHRCERLNGNLKQHLQQQSAGS